ncbi:MAG TPA: hypothetical protein PKC43_01040 [Phycisphaerales bacterium]|nr:hypothetical protein [Phycisphaerales bacterium]HMP36011.1 hypothetical protein [Phycisphaerales bacterium]
MKTASVLCVGLALVAVFAAERSHVPPRAPRAADSAPDAASAALLAKLGEVRSAVIECSVTLHAVLPGYDAPLFPLNVDVPGTAFFAIDRTLGHSRVSTVVGAAGEFGASDIAILGDSKVEAVNALARTGVFGQIPPDAHPTSAMMFPDPLILCAAHLFRWTDDRASTPPTWRDLGIELVAPASDLWSEPDLLPDDLAPVPGGSVLFAEFDGGSLDGAGMTWRVWREGRSILPLRTDLVDEFGETLTRIDFQTDALGGPGQPWPVVVRVSDFESGALAGWYELQVLSLAVNAPPLLPPETWSTDLSSCEFLFDLDEGAIVSMGHGR